MIDIAIDAAKQAGELALKYFKSQPKVFYKPDNTPVTRADREVEKLIRKIIAKKFPDHGIIGEEFEPVNPQARFKWVIDPIDGTKDFVRKIPMWSTFIAITENNKPIIGIASFPTTNEIFVAQIGKGTFLNGKKVKVSKITEIEKSTLGHGSINRIENIGYISEFLKIYRKARHRRGLDALCLNFILKGNMDIWINGSGGIHDFAAPAILVEEAGGKFTDFSGEFSITSGNAVATNGLLHKEVIQILNH